LAGTAAATNLVATAPLAHSVAIFEGSSVMTGVGPGTTGQVLRATTSGDPLYIDFPDVKEYFSCEIHSGTAIPIWNIPSSLGGSSSSRVGSNAVSCGISLADTTTAYFDAQLPEDWDSNSNPFVRAFVVSTDTTSGHTIVPTVAVSCAKGDGSTTDDVAFNAAQSLSTITTGQASRKQHQRRTTATATARLGSVTIQIPVS
jgi:hypothetical protein